jgi:hypothetical protein
LKSSRDHLVCTSNLKNFRVDENYEQAYSLSLDIYHLLISAEVVATWAIPPVATYM